MSYRWLIEDLPHYSYDDYKIWEGDWELIRGIPYAMAPASSWQYQDFGGAFVENFRQAIRKAKLTCDCRLLYSCDWIVSNDTVVRPDVMIVCDKIEGNYPTKPPVLIFRDIISTEYSEDRNTKFNLYESYGVKYYLLANVERKQIEVFVLNNNRYEQAENVTSFVLTNTCSVQVNL
jgi:Uma2 family endonuclease